MSKNYIGLVKYSLFLSYFNQIWMFSTDFSKNYQILNFMKICRVGAELSHVDGRTEMKLIVAFSHFRTHLNSTVEGQSIENERRMFVSASTHSLGCHTKLGVLL